MHRLVVFLGLSLLVGGQAQPEKTSHKKGTACWPLHFAGIVTGVATDSQVRRILGPGIFHPEEGDTGGRYYTDSKGTATLHVVEYTDRVVGELSVSRGIDPAIRSKEVRASVTRWFDPTEGFGNWRALHLGASKSEVLDNLGEPKEKQTADKWEYDTSCTCEIQDFFILEFKANRLEQITLVSPSG